jgi:hypothetical protein
MTPTSVNTLSSLIKQYYDFHSELLIMVKTREISAIVTKSAVWAYRFGERWIEFGIAIKTIHPTSAIV